MTSKRSLFTKLVPVLFVAALLIIATFGSSAANLPFFGGGDNNVAPHTGSLAPGHSAPGRRYAALMNSLAPLTATVQTDKADYHPGEYVVVTGSGWQAGENVELKFIDGLCAGPHLFTTLADGSGLISNSDFLVTSSHLGLTIYLTATGQSSGFTASTSFTDSEALGVPGNAGGFEVESNFFSGNVGGTGIATGADWSGANPVLLQSGGNSIPGFNVATNAIWTVDEYVGSGSPFTIDPTSFTGGQKMMI